MPAFKDEQTKLTAAFLNNVSVAIITAGVLVPGFALFYGTATLTSEQVNLVRLSTPTFFVIGIAILSGEAGAAKRSSEPMTALELYAVFGAPGPLLVVCAGLAWFATHSH